MKKNHPATTKKPRGCRETLPQKRLRLIHEAEYARTSPVPPYDSKRDGDYTSFLVRHNCD
jgi:hypothetical protein